MIGQSRVGGACSLVLRDIGIDPRGELLACCSAASVSRRGRLGIIPHSGLMKILNEAKKKTLFKILSIQGPARLADLLEIQWENKFVNRCHLCYEVLKASHLNEVLS